MMTSEEFKRVRQTIWRTQAEAAATLGVTEGAVAHWERGRRKVPGIVVKLLKCIEEVALHKEKLDNFDLPMG